MADLRKQSSTSNLIRFTLKNSSTGIGLTGLSSASSGLIISTICDNEATATVYTVAASNIETITTLGTYAAPTALKCRFKEVDATNHKGLYEFQFADAHFSVASAKRLIISVTGATNLLDADYEIQLIQADLYDAVRMGLTALPNAVPGAADGLLIAGLNAATTFATLTVTGTSTFTGNVSYAAGITITQSTTDGNGLTITGNGSGSGMKVNGGSTMGIGAEFNGFGWGWGLSAIGGATADGMYLEGKGGAAGLYAVGGPTNGAGIQAQGQGSGAGLLVSGGPTNADGIEAQKTGTGTPIRGDITGNLSGSVNLVTTGVTVTTNNDKTGYALSTAGVQAIWGMLTSALTAVGSIGKRLADYIDTTISSRLSSAGYTAPDNVGISSILTESQSHPTLTEIEASTVLAKEATSTAIKAKTDTIVWTDITDIKDGSLGKWSINKTTNVLTMYRADGVTVLKTFNLTDNASVSERVPA